MRLVLLLVLFLSGTGLSAGPIEQEMALAKDTLRALQAQSIQNNREYCGLIGRDPQGRLVVTEAVRGNRARCRYPDPPPGTVLVASYHTHGAFLRNAGICLDPRGAVLDDRRAHRHRPADLRRQMPALGPALSARDRRGGGGQVFDR